MQRELDNLVELWKQDAVTIKEFENEIIFKNKGCIAEDVALISTRTMNQYEKINLEISQRIRDGDFRYTTSKNIDGAINDEEYRVRTYMQLQFGCDILNSKCKLRNGNCIILKKVVRSYVLLKSLCDDYLKNRGVLNNSIQDWCLVIGKRELYFVFEEYDIGEDDAKLMIDSLTYRKGVDIYDNPLMKISQGFLLIPSLVIGMDIVKVLLSSIEELDDRGENFEKDMIVSLKRKNMNCEKIVYKEGNEKYDCDMVIYCNNDIYFCECKAWNDFKNLRGYKEFYCKIHQAKKQLDRITDKMKTKLNFVKCSLNLPENSKIRFVYKVVITLNMLGVNRKIGDTYLIDSSCLIKFIQRDKPNIKQYGKNTCSYDVYNGYQEYSGEITSNKLLKVIRNPANIELTKKKLKLCHISKKIKGLTISYDKWLRSEKTTSYIEHS